MDYVDPITMLSQHQKSRKPKGRARRVTEYAQPLSQPTSHSKNEQNTFAFKIFPKFYYFMKKGKWRQSLNHAEKATSWKLTLKLLSHDMAPLRFEATYLSQSQERSLCGLMQVGKGIVCFKNLQNTTQKLSGARGKADPEPHKVLEECLGHQHSLTEEQPHYPKVIKSCRIQTTLSWEHPNFPIPRAQWERGVVYCLTAQRHSGGIVANIKWGAGGVWADLTCRAPLYPLFLSNAFIFRSMESNCSLGKAIICPCLSFSPYL